MTRPEHLPRINPFLVDRAETMCARRLRRHYQGLKGNDGPMLRGRVRDRLVDAARAAHATMGPPNRASFAAPPDLVPEERAVFRRAADHYLDLFGDEPLETISDPAWDEPAVADGGDFQVGGWIDLVGRRPDGAPELRQFELWGRRAAADPLESATILLAALRIRKLLQPDRLVVRHADLIHGRVDEQDLDLRDEGSALATRFSQRRARIQLRARAGEREATPGPDCQTCPYVQGCPALR